MAISTAGTDLWYAPGTDSNDHPTTGWITGLGEAITDFPGFESTVNTQQATPIIETKNHRYIASLGDSGGAQSMTINADDVEEALVDEMREAAAATKGVLWFALVNPNKKNAYVFKGSVGPESIPAVGVDGLFQETVSITLMYKVGKVAKSTLTTA
jgi:hypothetical protein